MTRSRPGREETRQDRAAGEKRRGPKLTDRFAMTGPWTVLLEQVERGWLMVATHRFTASPTRCRLVDKDWWEMTTMDEKRKEAARLVRAAERVADAETGEVMCCDVVLEQECPTFAAFMTLDVDDSGKPRLTATMTIFYEDGVFKAVLRDRNTDKTLWATATSLAELPGVLEHRLTQDIVEWRRSPLNGGKGGKK